MVGQGQRLKKKLVDRWVWGEVGKMACSRKKNNVPESWAAEELVELEEFPGRKDPSSSGQGQLSLQGLLSTHYPLGWTWRKSREPVFLPRWTL